MEEKPSAIETAALWRVFHHCVQDIKASNAHMRPDELQRIVDDAVSEIRGERRSEGRARRS